MKRNIIIGCIAAAFSLSACDNYLDIVPKGETFTDIPSNRNGISVERPLLTTWNYSRIILLHFIQPHSIGMKISTAPPT